MKLPSIIIRPVGRVETELGLTQGMVLRDLLCRVDVQCGRKKFLLLADVEGTFWILSKSAPDFARLTEDLFFDALTAIL